MTLTLDGAPIGAEEGEPVAVSLVGAGVSSFARSPKFHRPRGPACLRAACDGCLARVDEEPNVMTCRVAAREGLTVTSQNILGSRKVDLLRMTDWFFPDGMNHHELFAGVPGVQGLMQSFARRVAGLGKLPREVRAPRPALRREVDVVVVGSGPSGMAAALALASRGRQVEILDDALAMGGTALALGFTAGPFAGLLESFVAGLGGALKLRLATTAGGFFGKDLLVLGDAGVELLQAKDVVLAMGAHDGVAPFEGNDLPGVMSARAACRFLAHGVLVGERLVVCSAPDAGPFGLHIARAARAAGAEVTSIPRLPDAVLGASRVEGVAVVEGGERVVYDADALLIDLPPAPSYELALQAGATVLHEPRGYVVVPEGGKIAGGIWAVGELVGTKLEASAVMAEASRVASAICA